MRRHGIVYKLTSEHTDKCYIGSTFMKLKKRVNEHRRPSNTCASRILYGLGDVKAEILEEGLYETKKELHDVEGKYQRIENCINQRIINRSAKEYRQTEQHKIMKRKADRKYYANNKEKAYIYSVKPERKAIKNKKVQCECGMIVVYRELARHKTNGRHLSRMENPFQNFDL